MGHLLIFGWFFSLSLGLSAIVISFVLYIRSRSIPLLYFIFLLLILLFKTLLNTVNIYALLHLDAELLSAFLHLADKNLTALLIFLLPFFFRRFVHRPLQFRESLFWAIPALAAVFFVNISGLLEGESFLTEILLIISRFIAPVFLAGVSLYLLKIIYTQIGREKDSTLKTVLRIFLFGLPFFLFGILLIDIFYTYMVVQLNPYLAGLLLYPVFYFLWNILYFIFVIRYFLFRKFETERDKLRFLLKGLGLTAREMEVILALLTGSRNNEIADQLYISIETVKKHLQNIFAKLDVKSRVELVNFIRNRMDNY